MGMRYFFSENSLFILFLGLLALCIAVSYLEPSPLTRAVSQAAGIVISLYGGFVFASYRAASRPNRELQKLGKGISRGLLTVAIQLKSYAKEVRGYPSKDEASGIRFSSIGSQLEKIAEHAEQSFLTLKDTFDLDISPSDLVAPGREDLLISTGTESVRCLFCQGVVNVSVGISPGDQAPFIRCPHNGCRRGFTVVRQNTGVLLPKTLETFYVSCINCRKEIRVQIPAHERGLHSVIRYCYECEWKHEIDVPTESIVEGKSEQVTPVELSPTSLLDDNVYICPKCQKTIKHPTRPNTDRGDLLHMCGNPKCKAFLMIKKASRVS